jgi:hypothetical protein
VFSGVFQSAAQKRKEAKLALVLSYVSRSKNTNLRGSVHAKKRRAAERWHGANKILLLTRSLSAKQSLPNQHKKIWNPNL